ncbi:response regulator transcription factor [Alkalicella caledoniensis]|uniref:Stage 0 sporulation protein A homolog n=1 Tax=Alkalicella caledoniensis TaxID=2731377 RepID=A0A7G9W8P5_ALKCA|nr:response regulator transcription factor [Alkalicella caledoniensis]QNO15057.1 response regulator transcription factor [Alkalicella caledoniensis]
MSQYKLLLIEDDSSIRDILTYSLSREGFLVNCASNGKDGLKALEEFCPDLIILDLMLPDMSGFDICKKISQKYQLPIIMLTARTDIVDKVLGLELGADDYIPKPFDIRELVARIKVILRRIENMPKKYSYLYINSSVRINTQARTVFRDELEVKLKPKEFDLLLLLSYNKNRVFTRDEILDRVWSMDFTGDLRTVDVHVQRLRKKLDSPSSPPIIETVFGLGYKMNLIEEGCTTV